MDSASLQIAKLIPLFPLLGFLVNGLYSLIAKGNTKKSVVHTVACGALGLSFLLSLITFGKLWGMEDRVGHEVVLFDWIVSGALNVPAAFLIDPLSCVMLLVVTGVGFLIHIYSAGYMGGPEEAKGYARYFCYLNLFVFFMLLLVMGNNFLLLFVGWEGVGLCSYLLIGFWYTKDSAANAGKKAFVVNRIGDFGFLLGILLIFVTFGTLNFTEVMADAHLYTSEIATAITLLLFVGAIGKSAQIPLYVWLPDAMEGPTPVSALIHAATMVTAGVYMVARCSALFVMAPFSLMLVAIVGALTALFAAIIGVCQTDIKKVLAYSTVSQLGYMFLACGVASFSAGIFHLMTHAFFKGLLFLGAGSVIHAMSGEQDMRRMGGLRSHLPWTHKTFVIAWLAIIGIFPFAGFFSKDEILYSVFTADAEVFGGMRYVLYAVGLFTAFLTAFYMSRLVFLTFHGRSRVPEEAKHHLHESPRSMVFPLVVLAVLSLVGGWVGIPGNLNAFHHWLSPSFATLDASHVSAEFALAQLPGETLQAASVGEPVFAAAGVELVVSEAHEGVGALEIALAILSLGIALAGLGIAYKFYVLRPDIPASLAENWRRFHRLVYNKFFIDEIYEVLFVQNLKNIGDGLKWADEKIVDGIVNGVASVTRLVSDGIIWHDETIVDGTVNGIAKIINFCSQTWRKVQTGYVQNYGMAMLTAVAFMIFFLLVF